MGTFNTVSMFPKTGGSPTSPLGRGAATSAGCLAGSLVTLDSRVPSEVHAIDLSRLRGSVFTVDETLEASDILVLRAPGSSETFACSSTHRLLRPVDFPGEPITLPEFAFDVASLVAAGSTLESKPFAACGLLWAVRVSCVSHANPIQTHTNSPPPASSANSYLPNSVSGSRYQKTIGRDTTQTNCTFVTITLMTEYSHVSLEELRACDYALKQVQPIKASAPLPGPQAGAWLRYLN